MEFAAPIDEPITINSPFANRADPFTGRAQFHPGVDLRAQEGTPIYASADGKVVGAKMSQGDGLPLNDPKKKWWSYGNVISIDHGEGWQSRYAHLKKMLVPVGSTVQKGQLIALSGSTGDATGPHLHWEIHGLVNGKDAPVDPTAWLKNPRPEILEATKEDAPQGATFCVTDEAAQCSECYDLERPWAESIPGDGESETS